MSDPGKMWGGRFQGSLDPFFARFQSSLPLDVHLAAADVRVNRVWARALQRADVLTAHETAEVQEGLDRVEERWTRDGIDMEADVEDVHSLVEGALGEEVGDLAKKVHTGRSRNDQVATDLKIFLRDQVHDVILQVEELVAALVQLAGRHADLPFPGYTHLQRAQPITVGHHALAYVEMLARDRGRLVDALERLDTCPLGSGALAGTAFPVDRSAIADELDFTGGATRNSLDAVASRDHVCEVAFACSMVMLDLSRLCEDWIFFASHEARFLTFGDAVATGSSLMPQKRNPDAMELIRGKTGRVCGALQALMMTIKALPLAYDRDLQEDKDALFDALETTTSCLQVAATAVQSVEWDEERCRHEAQRGYLNATDLADLLVRQGVAFRDAHTQVGRAVDRAVQLGVELPELPEEERRSLLPDVRGDLAELLSVDAVLARRDVQGGTAPERVREQVGFWQDRLREWQEELADLREELP